MKKNTKFSGIACFLILSLLALPTLAQDLVTAKIDEYIRNEMRTQKIPGVSLAVIRDGKVVYAKGHGYANVEHQVPVKPETVFQSGSVGKAFTVMAVLMLVEDGKIRLDDTINKYFPDAPSEWNEITIRNLLEHTSGMAGYPKDFDFHLDRNEVDLYKLIQGVPLVFKRGEQRGYSNLGFVMLGILINKVTGQFYGDFLRERIFAPLQMNRARVISEADIILDRAVGYRLSDGQLKNQEWVAPSINTTADGALYLSVLDVAKWEGALNSGKLLKKSSYDAMWTPIKTNNGMTQPWGFSWQIENLNGKRIIEHSGGWQGFTANFSRYPDKKLTVIVFVNLRAVNPIRLTRGVQEIYHPELSIAGATPIHDREPNVTVIVKELLHKIAANKLTHELFVPPAGDDILSHSEAAATEFKSLGDLKRIELLARQERDNGSLLFHYRLTYESTKMVLTVGLAKNGKFNTIDLRRN